MFYREKSLRDTSKRYKNVVQRLENHLTHFITQVQTDDFRAKGIECLGVFCLMEKKKGLKDKTSTPSSRFSLC